MRRDATMILALIFGAVLGTGLGGPAAAPAGAQSDDGYRFVCDDGGVGLHLVDVLRATGEHTTFLALMEDARILPTARCAEAGSVFAIDTVITDVAVPSLPVQAGYRLVRALLYDDVRFVIWPTVGGAAIGIVVSLLVRRSGRRRQAS